MILSLFETVEVKFDTKLRVRKLLFQLIVHCPVHLKTTRGRIQGSDFEYIAYNHQQHPRVNTRYN